MRTARQITLLITAGLVAMCGPAHGKLIFTNQAPAGASWFTAGNWRDDVSPYASKVPTVADNAYIGSATGPGGAVVDGPGGVVYTLYFGTTITTVPQATLRIVPGGELYVKNWCYMGYQASAQLVITGGVFSGGDRLYVGYSPPFNTSKVEVVQYSGNVFLTNSLSSALYLNSAGYQYAPGYPRYRLVGGYVKSGYWYVGGKGYGKVEVEGGTNYLGDRLLVGHESGGEGVFLQSGGDVSTYSLELGRAGAQGRYELSGGSLHNRYEPLLCGSGGNGTFIQSGGTNDVSNQRRPGLQIGTKATGTGYYQISSGKLYFIYGMEIGTNGTFKIIGSNPAISGEHFILREHGILDLSLTNGLVSPITTTGSVGVDISGTLNVTLLGAPNTFPDRSTVVTIITHASGKRVGTFSSIHLEPANKLLDVRVNYNATSITLDQWKYAPKGTLLTIR